MSAWARVPLGDPRHTTGPCTYTYNDGARCIYNGPLLDAMCDAHHLITRQRESNTRLKAKARRSKRAPMLQPEDTG